MNLERNYQKCGIAIHSDSQAAIKALSSYVIDSKTIGECRNEVNEVGKKNKVFLIWVLDHSGIKGNEDANTLARMSLIGPEPICGLNEFTNQKEFLEKEKAERGKLGTGGISQGWIILLSSFGTSKQIQKIS